LEGGNNKVHHKKNTTMGKYVETYNQDLSYLKYYGRIKQIKLYLSNKRDETKHLHGKTSKWGSIHGSKAFLFFI